jgi:hypothetical protein
MGTGNGPRRDGHDGVGRALTFVRRSREARGLDGVHGDCRVAGCAGTTPVTGRYPAIAPPGATPVVLLAHELQQPDAARWPRSVRRGSWLHEMLASVSPKSP